MGIKKSWQATLTFRKFREKTHELSKIYWIMQLGADCLSSQLVDRQPDAFSVKELKGSFEFRMYPATVHETLSSLPNYLNRTRLYFLVIYTAFLESYLKEITFYYLLSKGYLAHPGSVKELMRLNPVGKALGAPILERSTVPGMIKYAASLYEIDFGKNADDWIKLYQLRCEAAHNGGIATPDLLKQISGMKLQLDPKAYEMLGLTWDELRGSMKAADEIAAQIDSKVASYPLQLLEAEQILRELKILERFPKRHKLWEYMHEEYGIKVKRQDKLNLESMFY